MIEQLESTLTQPASTSYPTKDKITRTTWLNQLRQARKLAEADPLPDFVLRQPMREPHGLTD